MNAGVRVGLLRRVLLVEGRIVAALTVGPCTITSCHVLRVFVFLICVILCVVVSHAPSHTTTRGHYNIGPPSSVLTGNHLWQGGGAGAGGCWSAAEPPVSPG